MIKDFVLWETKPAQSLVGSYVYTLGAIDFLWNRGDMNILKYLGNIFVTPPRMIKKFVTPIQELKG